MEYKYTAPYSSIAEVEIEHILLSFCTLCTILAGKKLSFQNVFLLILKDNKYRDIFKQLSDIDSDYEIVKLFIDYDNSITKSKYVTRHLNLQSKKPIS